MTKTTVAFGSTAREPLVVGVAEAHAVEQARDGAGEPVADPEVDVGVEGRDDLVRVAGDPCLRDLARRRGSRGVRLDRLGTFGS